MEESKFYITHVSNSPFSKILYPCNSPQSFKIKLPFEFPLEGRWELALTDIQFPRTWFNITRDSHLFILNSRRETGT